MYAYVLPMTVLLLQGQRWAAVTVSLQPAKSKIFTMALYRWALQEKFADPWFKANILIEVKIK